MSLDSLVTGLVLSVDKNYLWGQLECRIKQLSCLIQCLDICREGGLYTAAGQICHQDRIFQVLDSLPASRIMTAFQLEVERKPQDHIRQFKLRFRENYLKYFKIYYLCFKKTFILCEARLQKYLRKISVRGKFQDKNLHLIFHKIMVGQVYLVNLKQKKISWKIRITKKLSNRRDLSDDNQLEMIRLEAT